MAQVTSRRIRRIRQTKVAATVRTLGLTTKRADTSRQMYVENEFASASFAGSTQPIAPPYDPLVLLKIVEESNMIKQCVAAYITNIAECGMEVVQAHPDVPIDQDEADELQSFLENANSEESLATVNGKLLEDYENLGYGFLEVIRDRIQRISIMRHIRASTCRLMPKDQRYVSVQYEVRRGKRTAVITERRQFRRFCQIVSGVTRYYKEFGDPRRLNYETGEYETRENRVPESMLANELIHYRQNSEDAYGVPRWINQLPSILGSRESEEVNMRYFEDNTVPPILLTVAGGRLTQESFRNMEQILNQQGLGRERQHKMILLEAVPERESLDDKGTVTLKVDKLTDARQGDGLFKSYDEGNQQKVRSSFRLPPVAVGLSQDVTFATANVSSFLAETQVYLPQRRRLDEMYNKQIVGGVYGLNFKTVMLQSRAPAITNPQELMKTLTALNVMGALTPRTAIDAANRYLEVELPQYPEKGTEGWEEWMDKPIIFVTKGTESQSGQEQKSGEVKDVEQNGNTGPKAPENGQQ